MPRYKTESWNLKLGALAAAYAEHPLLAELNAMAVRYHKLEHRLACRSQRKEFAPQRVN